MQSQNNAAISAESSVWINNLVNGNAGTTLRVKQPILCSASPFQKIEVFDTYGYGLVLSLAGTIVFTERDEHIYHEMICHVPLLAHPKPVRVCIIGGGDGGCLRQVLRHSAVEHVTIVEIDAQVKEVVDAHFPLFAASFNDPRVSLIIDDGYHYLAGSTETFDVIIVDSYDPGGPVATLETADFFQRVLDRLAPDGLCVFQTDSPTLKSAALRSTIRSMSAIFPAYSYYCCSMPSFPEGICGFLLCGTNAAALHAVDTKRQAAVEPVCEYYSAQIHTGAFMLPRHIQNIINR